MELYGMEYAQARFNGIQQVRSRGKSDGSSTPIFAPMKQDITVKLVILVVSMVLTQACSSDSKNETQPVVDLTGQQGANVQGLTPDGDTLELAELDGCLKVLFFSQMDCKYCREMTPKLREMMDSYSEASTYPVVTYAYTAGSDTSGWGQYSREIQPTPPFHVALRINQEKTYIDGYHVKRTPTVYLIDDAGRIISPPLHNFDSVAVRTARYMEAKEGC